MLAGTDDHLTRLSPGILNLESTCLTHLESEIRVHDDYVKRNQNSMPVPWAGCELLTICYRISNAFDAILLLIT